MGEERGLNYELFYVMCCMYITATESKLLEDECDPNQPISQLPDQLDLVMDRSSFSIDWR